MALPLDGAVAPGGDGLMSRRTQYKKLVKRVAEAEAKANGRRPIEIELMAAVRYMGALTSLSGVELDWRANPKRGTYVLVGRRLLPPGLSTVDVILDAATLFDFNDYIARKVVAVMESLGIYTVTLRETPPPSPVACGEEDLCRLITFKD